MTGFTHKLTLFSVAVLLSLNTMQAQGPGPLPRHPGDVIKYQIVFDGPNADKITRVNGNLGHTGPMPKDQAGFAGGINSGNLTPSSPRTFILEFKVPDNIATGDYVLSFTGFAAEGYGNYANGQDFNVSLIHIENPKTFTPPGVKVTPLP
jgi:hypothetical protein